MRAQHCLRETAIHVSCGETFPDSWCRVLECEVLHHGAIVERNVRMETVQAQLSTLPVAT